MHPLQLCDICRVILPQKAQISVILNDFTCIIQKKVVLLHLKWLQCCNLLT